MSSLSAQIKDLTDQLNARNEELTTATGLVEELQAKLETATADLSAASDLNAEASDMLESLRGELDESKISAAARELEIREELETAKSELEQVKHALKDPAFADASAAGADPENLGGDSDAPSMASLKNLAGAERTAYWQKHKSALTK